MGEVERRLAAAGWSLPPALPTPKGVRLPFAPVLRRGSRVLIAGHGPQNDDGRFDGMCGKLGADLSIEKGYQAARRVALSVLASLKRELGELDRVTRWVKVFGMVNCTPTFHDHPAVINGFSDLVFSLYGEERGSHVRSAVGMAQLPFNIAVEVEAEVEVDEP